MDRIGRVRRLLAAVLLCAIVVGAAPVTAADDVEILVGTVTKIDEAFTRMTITWTADDETLSEEVAISQATSITRDGVGVPRSEVTVGVAVTVLAMENPYLILDVLEATDILLGRQDVHLIFQ